MKISRRKLSHVSKLSAVRKSKGRASSKASRSTAAARGRRRAIRQLSDLHVFAVSSTQFGSSRPRQRFTPGWTAEATIGGTTFGPVTLTSFGVAVFDDIPTPTPGSIRLTIDDADGNLRFQGTYPSGQRYLVARF